VTDQEFARWIDETACGADVLEARRLLEMGDLTHVIIRRDGGVSVNRGSSWMDERLDVDADEIAPDIHTASRCRDGRKYGPEVRRIADRLPAVCEEHQPYRWQA
jgi:hypothetical protein